MEESSLTIIQHLEELRKRIIYTIVSIIAGAVIAYSFIEKILFYISRPMGQLVFIQPIEAFVTHIKLAVFCGIFISFPVILYQIWAFVSPGLRHTERRYILLFAPLSLALFLVGCAFSYFLIIPFGIKFLMGYSSEWLRPMISVGSYVSFFCIMTLVFGIVFEMPVVILFLTKIRIVNPRMLRKKRKYAILIIFIAAALLTPPDVFTQVMMAVPLVILYEISIYISYLGRPTRPS